VSFFNRKKFLFIKVTQLIIFSAILSEKGFVTLSKSNAQLFFNSEENHFKKLRAIN